MYIGNIREDMLAIIAQVILQRFHVCYTTGHTLGNNNLEGMHKDSAVQIMELIYCIAEYRTPPVLLLCILQNYMIGHLKKKKKPLPSGTILIFKPVSLCT